MMERVLHNNRNTFTAPTLPTLCGEVQQGRLCSLPRDGPYFVLFCVITGCCGQSDPRHTVR
jgi:hypothetical protein